ncbi:hypothetical protein CAC42_281 [Sphaceloma murrayae]|uniref:Fe2OG dioxygenase domain-containing protein n=1 Tax=Sphaceloma murrayae TaxID=2082308 RepID=A0A2K1QN50_9PEZI|nr:hypothetical protein CAC42_281 [Sphaceloma murrayae]
MKRKTLHDFFLTPHPTSNKRSQPGVSMDLPQEVDLKRPPGLSIIMDFVSHDEEQTILSFLEAQTWRTDLSRRTMHFGGEYCLMPPRNATPELKKIIERDIITAPPMPQELDFLVDKMVRAGLYRQEKRPAYCIVNEYLPGQGISAHVENFRFGEPVVSLTLAGSDSMRFHHLASAHAGSVRSGNSSLAPRTGRQEDVVMQRRSLLILREDARSTWQHEIRRTAASSKPLGWRRVSLTFRVDKTADHKGHDKGGRTTRAMTSA